MYAKDDGNGDVSNIRKKKRTLCSNAKGMGERMQQKIKEMLIKIKDVLVSVWHSYKRMRQENNIYFNIINYPIEKCSSPTGDGNIYPFIRAQNNKLY